MTDSEMCNELRRIMNTHGATDREIVAELKKLIRRRDEEAEEGRSETQSRREEPMSRKKIEKLIQMTRFGAGGSTNDRVLAVRRAAFAELKQLAPAEAAAIATSRRKMNLPSLELRGFVKEGDSLVWRGGAR